MSLAFLSKKSWHTANLRNVEKVWIAEQKHAAEEKKVAELRKNIEEERQLQELRQLQAARGDKSAAMERVDWMYEGPSAAREKTAEEFLLGKEYKGEDEKKPTDDVDLSTTSKYGSLALSESTLPAHDAFQRLNEDPMMLIRKRHQAAREQVIKNPVKMKKIKDQVDRLIVDKKARKKAKKIAKKEEKRARKEKKRLVKKRNKERESSNGCGNEGKGDKDQRHGVCSKKHQFKIRSRSRSRSRSDRRSRSPVLARCSVEKSRGRSRNRLKPSSRDKVTGGHRRKRSVSSDRRSASSARNRHYRSRSRSGRRYKQRDSSCSERILKRDDFGRNRSYRCHDKRKRFHSRSRSLSRSPARRRKQRRSRTPVNRRDRRWSRSSSQKRTRARSGRREDNQRKQSLSWTPNVAEKQREKQPESKRKLLKSDGKYGLLSKRGAVESNDIDKTSLGPNAKYLAKARESKRLQEEDRRRKVGKASEFHQMTDEEKKRRAQQMVEDAKVHDDYITKRATLTRSKGDECENEASSSNPEFLRKLHTEAYLNNDSTMGDRLRRNTHYIQRNADSSNFLTH